MPELLQLDPTGNFQRGRRNALSIQGQEQSIAREAAQAPVRNQLNQLGLKQKQAAFKQQGQKFDQNQAMQRAKIMNQTATALKGLAQSQRKQALASLAPKLQQFGFEASDFEFVELTDDVLDQVTAETQAIIGNPNSLKNLSAGQREFADLTEGLSEEDLRKAKRIKLRLDPGATGAAAKTVDVGGVPHIFDPVKQTLVPASVGGKDVTAESVGDSKKTIAERKEFGKKTGVSRANAIDDGFEKITKINAAIGNMDRAISLLDKGAGVGAIERFAPSYKAASVELDNIRESMALDVIGAVTFGALSQGELDLAKRVALPTGLDSAELKQHLVDRKAAQTKLRDYYDEQIQFLDQGGSIAGFLRKKRRESPQAQTQQPAQQPAAEVEYVEGAIYHNKETKEKIMFINGEWEAVQ